MRALYFSLLLALLLPIDGWSARVFFGNGVPPSAQKSAFACMIGSLSREIEREKHIPIEESYFVTPRKIGIKSSSLFVTGPSGDGSSILNPAFYERLFKEMQPLFERHQKGYLSVSSVEEANRISNYLNLITPGKKFAPLHPHLSKKERDQLDSLYKSGKINFFVVVKEMETDARFSGLSLYADLNRNLEPRSFLDGVARIFFEPRYKKQVDIISLAELNEVSVREHMTLLDQMIKTSRSDQSRTEWNKLRTDIQKTGYPKLITIEKAADDTIDHIRLHGEVPLETTDYALYQRVIKYQDDPAFIARLKNNPNAWRVFQKSKKSDPIVKRSSKSVALTKQEVAAKNAANKAFTYILRKNEVPPGFYKIFYKFKNERNFIEIFQKNEKVWKILLTYVDAIQKISPRGIVAREKAAQEIVVHMLKTRSVPKESDDSALYQKYIYYRNDPIVTARIQDSPEAWEIYTKPPVREQPSLSNKAITYFNSKGTMPPKSSALYKELRKYRRDSKLLEELKEHPKVFKAFKMEFETAIEKAARDIIKYILDTGEVPKEKNGLALYMRFKLYRNDAEFIALIKENPKAWEVFAKWQATPYNAR